MLAGAVQQTTGPCLMHRRLLPPLPPPPHLQPADRPASRRQTRSCLDIRTVCPVVEVARTENLDSVISVAAILGACLLGSVFGTVSPPPPAASPCQPLPPVTRAPSPDLPLVST